MTGRWKQKQAKILGDLKIDIDPRQTVGDLPVSKQQMVEIAKALSIHAKILIMDEPTSSLTAKEIDELVPDHPSVKGGRMRNRLYFPSSGGTQGHR